MSRLEGMDPLTSEVRPSNPYRAAFYQRQAEWHGYDGVDDVRARHETRCRYYEWFTRGWLPEDRDCRILDIGCGSGQFLYFLKKKGYTNARGIDLDRRQVEIGRSLGLDIVEASAFDHFQQCDGDYGLVAMLDIIEHFTREELFPLMEIVTANLRDNGRVIASVPNAESPTGLSCYFADITHEMSFTPGSFEEMLFCHHLELRELRDPWPVPLDLKRSIFRGIVKGTRALEGLRMRALGFVPPRVWSNVMWALAVKSTR